MRPPRRVYPTDQEAFRFLQRCVGSKFDMTSAEALKKDDSGIFPPSKPSELFQEKLDSVDFSESHGTSRGEDLTLQECVKFFGRYGVSCEQENVSLTPGILPAIRETFGNLGLNQDRKILVLTPTFGYYFQQLKEKNIDFETLATKAEDGFLPNPKELEEAIVKSGAVALLLCYPNNPTGAVMTEECASEIAAIAKKHNIFVISDEAFLRNSLSEKKHFPIAAIDGMLDRSLTFTSNAKSMFPPLKVGFCVGKPEMVDNFKRLGGYPTKNTQRVLAASLEDSLENEEYLAKCREHYLKNIDLIGEKLTQLNRKFAEQFGEEAVFVKPLVERPDATNVYMLDFSGLRGKKYGETSMNSGLDVAKWLLNEAGIGTVPGECFLFEPESMLVRVTLNHSFREIGLAFDSAIEAASKIEKSETPSPSPLTPEAARKVVIRSRL